MAWRHWLSVPASQHCLRSPDSWVQSNCSEAARAYMSMQAPSIASILLYCTVFSKHAYSTHDPAARVNHTHAGITTPRTRYTRPHTAEHTSSLDGCSTQHSRLGRITQSCGQALHFQQQGSGWGQPASRACVHKSQAQDKAAPQPQRPGMHAAAAAHTSPPSQTLFKAHSK